MVGNSSAVKNHGRALAAMHELPLDLYFHGDETSASADERSLLNSMQDKGRIRFRGTADPAESLLAADAYAMPSKHEGMSIALAEALVVGVPAIINEAPGQSWAYGWPGVSVLQDNDALWREQLQLVAEASDSAITHQIDLPVDLSAKRGAGEYAALYRRLERNV